MSVDSARVVGWLLALFIINLSAWKLVQIQAVNCEFPFDLRIFGAVL